MNAQYLLEWLEFAGIMALWIIGGIVVYIIVCVLCSLFMWKEINDDCMTYEHYNPDASSETIKNFNQDTDESFRC